MINSRSLTDLDPAAREVCNSHLALCRHAGIELIVTSTWRDFEAQAGLFAIGRTVQRERRPVTNARAGHSWHNFKVAWDVVPVVEGKPVWDANDPLWKEVVRLGKQAGAEAGADWETFPDLPHFQLIPVLPDGTFITLAEAQVRFQNQGTIFVV